MAKIKYIEYNPARRTADLIERCNEILTSYDEQGFDMTLRQLYYQLVSADEIPNNQKQYDRLGALVNKARLGGLIDWDLIVDRTRNLKALAHWRSPSQIIDATVENYRRDKWASQPHRIEVWIEKDALAGVFARVCNELDVPFFSCRGYTSQSEMHEASKRFSRYQRNAQKPLVLHFGDHDPSGIDMSRDIEDRLELFSTEPVEIRRLALNMDQVRKFNPPPNPAKMSDSRFESYIAKFGRSSWELDALKPDVLAGLVRAEIEKVLDGDAWDRSVSLERAGQKTLRKIAENYTDVEDYVDGL